MKGRIQPTDALDKPHLGLEKCIFFIYLKKVPTYYDVIIRTKISL